MDINDLLKPYAPMQLYIILSIGFVCYTFLLSGRSTSAGSDRTPIPFLGRLLILMAYMPLILYYWVFLFGMLLGLVRSSLPGFTKYICQVYRQYRILLPYGGCRRLSVLVNSAPQKRDGTV